MKENWYYTAISRTARHLARRKKRCVSPNEEKRVEAETVSFVISHHVVGVAITVPGNGGTAEFNGCVAITRIMVDI